MSKCIELNDAKWAVRFKTSWVAFLGMRTGLFMSIPCFNWMFTTGWRRHTTHVPPCFVTSQVAKITAEPRAQLEKTLTEVEEKTTASERCFWV